MDRVVVRGDGADNARGVLLYPAVVTTGERVALAEVLDEFVLVEQLELEFDAGLGVLTGETGAGKSILLDALGLALGARSDAGLVRSGAVLAAATAVIGEMQ